MVHHSLGLRHYEKHKKLQPHSNRWKQYLDRGMFFVALIGPLVTLPQVVKIWSAKDASNLSPITWSTWLALAFVWLIYGVSHNEKPIVAVNIGWILINTSIVLAILLYG
ncbi:hypothetical protein HY497_01990 [Candidatus Woesearchaeota archaeon]|nr:hypothetical protein [Candidatus Woesearchaeota archaeon]